MRNMSMKNLSMKNLSMKNLSMKNLSVKNLSSMFLLSVRAVWSTMCVCVLLLGTGHHRPQMVDTACVVSSIRNGGNSRLNVDIGLCSNLFMDIGFGFYFLMHIRFSSNFFMNICLSCRGLLRSRGSSSSSNPRQQDKELHYGM